MAEKFKVTYATLSADNPQMHADYEDGIGVARKWLGREYPFYVGGEARTGDGVEEERSPIDNDILIGRFAVASEGDVDDAVAAARAAFPKWSGLDWTERVAIMSRAAEL